MATIEQLQNIQSLCRKLEEQIAVCCEVGKVLKEIGEPLVVTGFFNNPTRYQEARSEVVQSFQELMNSIRNADIGKPDRHTAGLVRLRYQAEKLKEFCDSCPFENASRKEFECKILSSLDSEQNSQQVVFRLQLDASGNIIEGKE